MTIDCDTQLTPDWIWAVMTILQEARNQNLDGMIAVAEVIRNRAQAKFFSDGTIIGTVLNPYQFSGWNTKDPNRLICGKLTYDNPMTQQAMKAWRLAIMNNTEMTSGALYYHTKQMSPFPDWAKSGKLAVTATIGDHIFYKDKV